MIATAVHAAASRDRVADRRRVRLLAVYVNAASAGIETADNAETTNNAGASVRTETPRQRELRTSRRALGLLLGTLGLSAAPGSLRFPHRRFSLSHTERGSVALAALGPLPAALAGVGVDLEQDRLVDHRAARFFLSGPERDWLAALPERRRHRDHVRLWTVKEALFKADPANAGATLLGFRALDPAARAGRAVRPGARTVFGYVSGLIQPDLHLSVAASFAPGAGDGAAATTKAQAPIERGYGPMPTSAITFEAVAERISAMLNVPIEKITPQTTLHDLAADSFRLVETVVDLQEEFDSMFTQAELKQVSTLGELVELLRSQR